jgi:hypothetical protein
MESVNLLKHDVANIIARNVEKLLEPVKNVVLTVVTDSPYDQIHHLFAYDGNSDTLEELLNTYVDFKDEDYFDEYDLYYTLKFQKKKNIYVFQHDSAFGKFAYLIDFKKRKCDFIHLGHDCCDQIKISFSFCETECG